MKCQVTGLPAAAGAVASVTGGAAIPAAANAAATSAALGAASWSRFSPKSVTPRLARASTSEAG